MSRASALLLIASGVTATASAAPPPTWPLPWADWAEETAELGKRPAAPADTAAGRTCDALVSQYQKASDMELEAPRCVVEREVAGAGALRSASVVRLVADGGPVTDAWYLVLDTDRGAVIGTSLADGSYSGVGGWTRQAAVDDIEVTETPAGVVVVAYAREYLEDTDMGVNAQTEEREARMAACLVIDGQPPRCARVTTNHFHELTRAVEDTPDVPPKEYGPLGATSWARSVRWDPTTQRFEVGRETGRRPKSVRMAKLPATPTITQLLKASARR